MNLLTHIKRERKQQRKKKPLKRDVFNQIGGLVRWYGLKENFLDVLDKVEDYLSKEDLQFTRVRLKTPMERSLFSLVTESEYSLTLSIISKVDNSYLQFAESPEEILLCRPLFRLNPTIGPEKLMRYHFETLLLHERASTDNMNT
ncbi:MAG: hypothetical protein E3J94_06580 [Desulfobacteraceae bacterium]|nr:MAG: hypothetical protein E3J94_06580 [Desulfobacteraceae bacterium]